MKIRIIGAGVYGCHLAASLLEAGHQVTVEDIRGDLLLGASGNIPARLHQGFHYPRSKKTRDACLAHTKQFLDTYGIFTRAITTNIYAVAADKSLVDFDQYTASLEREVPFKVIDPEQYGLRNVEGAVLTEERHVVTDSLRSWFKMQLRHPNCTLNLGAPKSCVYSQEYDLNIDATFCANDNIGVDRYEPCIVGFLSGPTSTAVTIMDGPFGSLYPWNEEKGLNSLSSAKYTPLSKHCKTYEAAFDVLKQTTPATIQERAHAMLDDLAHYYPRIKDRYHLVQVKTSIRAMPLSGADSRLVDLCHVGDNAVRIRAGKIDAVVQAGDMILKLLEEL